MSRPPREAYLFFPKGKDLIEFDEKTPEKTLRRIFEGEAQHSSFELDKIKGFYKHLDDYNKLKNEGEKVLLSNFSWNEAATLRLLQSNSYDYKQTLLSCISYIEWRKNYLPAKPSENICKILNIGFMYTHGRDNRFRPIIVLKVRDFKRNYDKFVFEDWLRSIIYLIEYVVQALCIKGQIENWNILCDCEEASVFSLPSEFKKLLQVLQDNYKCRLYQMYIMNIPFILRAIWILVKGVLDQTVQKKIQMVEPGSKELFATINKSQIEKRFGGTAPNMNSYYFPHTTPSNDYFVATDKQEDLLITDEEYRHKAESGAKLDISPYYVPIPAAKFIIEEENQSVNIKEVGKSIPKN
jgi:hypothetical protein